MTCGWKPETRKPCPRYPLPKLPCLLYVFGGAVTVNETISLTTGESMLIEGEAIRLSALETSDLVLFVTDPTAPYSVDGMYSGNQKYTHQMRSPNRATG